MNASRVRGPLTLLAAALAGLVVWSAAQLNGSSTGGYWAVAGIMAGAGLILGASQVFGTREWGRPAVSLSMLLTAFTPALVVVGWTLVAGEPHANTLQSHVLAWSNDLGVASVVRDLSERVDVLAFGLGLLFGLTLRPADRRQGRAVPAATTLEIVEDPIPIDEDDKDDDTAILQHRDERIAVPSAQG